MLRHVHADARLSEYGHDVGLLKEDRYAAFKEKQENIHKAITILSSNNIDDKDGLKKLMESHGFDYDNQGFKGIEILKRPTFSYNEIAPLCSALNDIKLTPDSVLSLETVVKFEGYLEKQRREADRLIKAEGISLPTDLDYLHIDGLRLEARQKLNMVRPLTLAQASRIPGVNPADLSILLLYLRKERKA